MKRSIPLLFVLACIIPGAFSQNAPITTAATVGGAVPGTVSVPITVTGFVNIGAISLTIDYNYSVLHFINGVPNSQLQSFPCGDYNLGTGYHRITMGWYSGSGVTLADGSTIMTLNFTYIAGNTALTWYDNGPSCEYADGNYNVLNDIPTSTYYINGYVCGGMLNPGTITGDNNLCAGETGITYSINPVTNATGYSWTVPPGATIVNGQNTTSILVDYSAGATSGNVTVCGVNACGNGPVSQLAVTVNPLPYANAGPDVSIPYGTSTTLNGSSGGSGSYSYHWKPESLLVNAYVQNPQTVNLTSTTVFTMIITNQATQCNDSDEVVVTITGGPLNINPEAIPDIICASQYSQLYSNAGGGSGNYTYSWTCDPPGSPPWTSTAANPAVNPPVSTLYLLTVNDGFNSVSGSTYLTVLVQPTATVSGGDSLCDNGSTTTVTIDFTGTPPWFFIYSDGLNSFIIPAQTTTPFILETSSPGTYTVLFVQDANCIGIPYGSANVLVFPIPDTPVISLFGNILQSSLCCGNQWYLDDEPIPGATGQFYTPVENGMYYDIVTVNGCVSDTSNIMDIIVSVDKKKTEPAWLYPNPARESVKFRGPAGGDRRFRILFTNMYGVKVKEFSFDLSGPGNEKDLSIGDLAPGFYLVTIEHDNKTQYIKLVKE